MFSPSNEANRLKWLENAISNRLINYFDHNEFRNIKKISDSEISLVHKSEWTKCGLIVALKSVNFDIEGNDVDSFIKELHLLQRASFHPKINHFYGITKDSRGCYKMVLQFANDGDLRGYLTKNFSKLEWKDKYHIAWEIAQGLVFLHNNKIIHRNLHPKNILVHENKIMISDFGLSKLMASDSNSTSLIDGLPAFMDPQCFKNPTYKRTYKTDIYSYGVVLWEISSGHKPFPSLKRTQISIKIYNGEREKPVEGTPSDYVDLYKRCWNDEPDNRPKIEEILDFFNLHIVKPTDTHVNTEGSSDVLIEKAISKGMINFYNYDQFSDLTMIADETFSSLYKSEWKLKKSTIALKCLKVNYKFLDEKVIKTLQFLQNIKDQSNVVQFYGVTKDPCSEHYSMILQFADGGNLHDYLIRNSGLQWTKKFCVAIEIAKGLKYLHENNIAHLDLHPGNIWVSEEKMLVVGFCMPENVSFSSAIIREKPAYTEPQCLKDPTYQRDMRSDIYSLGFILWVISSGRQPFQSFETRDVISVHVFNGNREIPVKDTPPEYEQLYKSCWDEDPEKRPSIILVLEKLEKLQIMLSV
ncbi:kinase-like domain-containing protein [Gigaspora rosea]|uniref:Kinase-like domain-containing protein n=1 Tax=Gigaspora rosea TaxID=44941 RepID=A0A397W0J4_9GLOM|nr:kinase-like domain-containing protein [Gigaspora rosea]